jgi:hypothetical protein
MALEVFGREATLGEEGFIGNGGGARSGSELSHLESFKLTYGTPSIMIKAYIGTIALPPSEDADC